MRAAAAALSKESLFCSLTRSGHQIDRPGVKEVFAPREAGRDEMVGADLGRRSRRKGREGVV